MPGGASYRKWYAARARLRREGRWTGDKAEDPGAEGPEKKPRLEEETAGGTSREEETEKQVSDRTPEGKTIF